MCFLTGDSQCLQIFDLHPIGALHALQVVIPFTIFYECINYECFSY